MLRKVQKYRKLVKQVRVVGQRRKVFRMVVKISKSRSWLKILRRKLRNLSQSNPASRKTAKLRLRIEKLNRIVRITVKKLQKSRTQYFRKTVKMLRKKYIKLVVVKRRLFVILRSARRQEKHKKVIRIQNRINRIVKRITAIKKEVNKLVVQRRRHFKRRQWKLLHRIKRIKALLRLETIGGRNCTRKIKLMKRLRRAKKALRRVAKKRVIRWRIFLKSGFKGRKRITQPKRRFWKSHAPPPMIPPMFHHFRRHHHHRVQLEDIGKVCDKPMHHYRRITRLPDSIVPMTHHHQYHTGVQPIHHQHHVIHHDVQQQPIRRHWRRRHHYRGMVLRSGYSGMFRFNRRHLSRRARHEREEQILNARCTD